MTKNGCSLKRLVGRVWWDKLRPLANFAEPLVLLTFGCLSLIRGSVCSVVGSCSVVNSRSCTPR